MAQPADAPVAAGIVGTPLDMLLWCPGCGTQHVDAPDRECSNPPHRRRLWAACGCIWRLVDVPANGVAAIATEGSADTWRSKSYPRPKQGWTCFHCGQTFWTLGAARFHFGADRLADAACRIKAGDEMGLVIALREAQDELARHRPEDSEMDCRFHAMQADHAVALRGAEENSYAKALKDYIALETRLAAIRRRLIRFHLQDGRKAAAMTRLSDEIAVLVQDSVAPDVSASGLNA